MTPSELQSKVDSFRWYHEIEVAPGVKTKPSQRFDVSWDLIGQAMPLLNLNGKNIVDIGTRDGKYAFQAERMGASVIAIDSDQSQGAIWLKEHFASKVVFSAQTLEHFFRPRNYFPDIIFLFGVLYHLRYPMSALRLVSDSIPMGGKLYIESGMLDWQNEFPLLYCPVRKSPYEQSSCSFFNLAGLTETLWSFGCTVKSWKTHLSENGKMVRRFWIEAEKTHEMPEKLQKYWEGVHTSHD